MIASPSYIQCRNRNQKAVDVFLVLCIHELFTTNGKSYSSATALALSDFCFHSGSGSYWPARNNCRFLEPSLREWSGAYCEKQCLFGHFDKHDKCICMNGFHSVSCSAECLGGFKNPCYGHSICDKKSGTCNCLKNFYHSSCNKCAKNWTSIDCGIAKRSPDIKTFVCQSFEKSLISFSGRAVNLNAYGEYYILKSSEFEIQGRYIPWFKLLHMFTFCWV